MVHGGGARGAVGFLEAQGFVPALDAADAMTKAAHVRVHGVSRLGGGLVSICLSGDLAQVVEAIEVGEETVRAHRGVEVRAVVFPNPCPTVRAVAHHPDLVR